MLLHPGAGVTDPGRSTREKVAALLE